jgi:hypothetical protein
VSAPHVALLHTLIQYLGTRAYPALTTMAEMDVDPPTTVAAKKGDDKKRFEVKKVRCLFPGFFCHRSFIAQWNAVALWAWGMCALSHPLPSLASALNHCRHRCR